MAEQLSAIGLDLRKVEQALLALDLIQLETLEMRELASYQH